MLEYGKKGKKDRIKMSRQDGPIDPFAEAFSSQTINEELKVKDVSDPRDARGYYLRGLSFEKRGDHSRAMADYDKAIGLDPKLAWAYYRRGLAHGERGNLAQQSKDLKAAARLGLWDGGGYAGGMR
jgi:tetratricopeptide (TPR) repeat protein